MVLGFALAFVTGFITKLTDNLVDEPFVWHGFAKNLLGITYGFLAGFLVAQSTEFATLVLAITISVLIAGKIDDRAHQLAVAALIATTLAFGLPQVSIPFMALFVLLGFADEKLNDWADKRSEKGIETGKVFGLAVKSRLILEAGALAIGVITSNWVYFFALLLFDLGYNFADRLMPFFIHSTDFFYTKQILLQCVGCKKEKLDSIKVVRQMLNEMPSILELKKISEPNVFNYKAKNTQDSGISGVVVIAESHIAIHTFPEKGFALVAVSSCKSIDSKKVKEYVSKKLGPRGISEKVVEKGRGWPKNIEKAAAKAKDERQEVIVD